MNVVVSVQVKSEFSSLPVAVRGSETRTGACEISTILLTMWNHKRSDLEIHETRNMSDRNRRFGASCAIIKVT